MENTTEMLKYIERMVSAEGKVERTRRAVAAFKSELASGKRINSAVERLITTMDMILMEEKK